MRADSYYGARAKTYDDDRINTLRWAREQGAVADFVTQGPVLDCPLGTGRYIGIYRDKGLGFAGVDVSADMISVAREKHGEIEAHEGSIFALPFGDGAFATAVCTRMLDWFSPSDMRRAVRELRRVAESLVVSIRLGIERIDTNQTHDVSNWYEAIDGLYIADRRVTEEWHGDTEEIFHLRPPVWSDLIRQFEHHGHSPDLEMQRLACAWFGHVDLSPETCNLTAEYWTGDDLFSVIADMSAQHDETAEECSRYITDLPPRYPNHPVTLMRKAGRTVVLDGRRRINSWKDSTERHPVLLLTWKE
jgi:ubiquinone/menaquinone biosynthesis C-methylase UbiE